MIGCIFDVKHKIEKKRKNQIILLTSNILFIFIEFNFNLFIKSLNSFSFLTYYNKK